MKIAILTDSNCGINKEEANKLGIYVLPMPFYIGDEVYYEDIDLTQEEFYIKLDTEDKITTSMPVVGDVIDKWCRNQLPTPCDWWLQQKTCPVRKSHSRVGVWF